MTEPSPPPLPVLEVLPRLRSALAGPGAAVLVAPPGTGKTTGVPPALLDEPWAADGRIVVVQPRRLAARSAARRIAAQLPGDGGVGGTVGYSVRGDREVGPATRIELVTEGLLLRRLQRDPTLASTAAVLLDEFHERSADIDLLLALLLDVRSSLRPDLRLLVMSATLDPGPVAALLGDGDPAPVVTATAPLHPVRTLHRPGSVRDRLEDRVAAVVREALAAGPEADGVLGDLLVFLPGRGEIRRTHAAVGGLGPDVVVHELHGSVPAAEQDAALRPDPRGRRRVVLATSVAETSITVEGVRVVVDAGRRRTVRVDPATALPGLVTVAVSRAGADQRRGRAGRTGPGTCYRLWSADEERHRPAADRPEVLDGDLSALLLQVRAWGATPEELRFLDPPTGPHLDAARGLLADLGATGPDGRLTARGRDLADLGFHPRLGAVVLEATSGPLGPAGAAELAALLEVDLPGEPDLVERWRALRRGDAPREVREAAREWRRRVPDGRDRRRGPARAGRQVDADGAVAGAVVAGYRDRLARRRTGTRTDDRGRPQSVYQLVGGGEVAIRPADHPLARSSWLAVVALDRGADGTVGTTHLAVAVEDELALDALADRADEEREVTWDPGRREVAATARRRVGAIVLDERRWPDPPADEVRRALAAGVRSQGPEAVFDRWHRADELLARLALVRAVDGPVSGAGDGAGEAATGPDLDALLDRVASSGTGSRRQLATVDVASWLSEGLAWDERRALDELAPLHLELPSGRRVRLRYEPHDATGDGPGGGGPPPGPVLATRLQDLLGTDVHPTVGGGRVPVVLELLSPAGRPVQRTSDLPGFWRGSYAAVRSELRGRYPKHAWPERPWEI
ncbi:ATP-dependent helicase HrpB [Dermatobacter hominis]|uniref:ATP-dependent helicase HrpB n=1 Tax=Dermatobacter hominis TaxID=2884263 RepID=UPI001D109CC1|nr:ATP-dependent helicase HrpB [Dermatobacter hominis]UDY34736.1 ATP-dependent helicase HrpB [Dermatobacter hominis]